MWGEFRDMVRSGVIDLIHPEGEGSKAESLSLGGPPKAFNSHNGLDTSRIPMVNSIRIPQERG